jgi:hypothetical protein
MQDGSIGTGNCTGQGVISDLENGRGGHGVPFEGESPFLHIGDVGQSLILSHCVLKAELTNDLLSHRSVYAYCELYLIRREAYRVPVNSKRSGRSGLCSSSFLDLALALDALTEANLT